MSARDALVALAERDGYITPASVLDEARDETSPLHQHFTWDDDEAAEKYRLVQAGNLIRRYKVTVVSAPEQSVRVRQFSHAPTPGGDLGYITTEAALSTDEGREFVMQQAARELAALRAKYQALVDFDEVLRRALAPPKKRRAA